MRARGLGLTSALATTSEVKSTDPAILSPELSHTVLGIMDKAAYLPIENLSNPLKVFV